MRAVSCQLAEAHAVQHVRGRLVGPHNGGAVGITSCI
jgi:hypothetical protein